MYAYVAYGLHISSDIRLDGLEPGEGPADIVVRRTGASVCGPLPPPERGVVAVEPGLDAIYAQWTDLGQLRAHGGQEILLHVVPDADPYLCRAFVVSFGLPMLLHQRGVIVMHASAVGVDGQAIAFLGPPGQGKSTTAAAFYTRGHCVMADDLSAIATYGAQAWMLPAFPQLRLFPQSGALLSEMIDASTFEEVRDLKQAHRTNQGFPAEPLPVHAFYVLADGDCVRIEPLAPTEALLALLSASPNLSFDTPGEATSATLQAYHALIQRTPCYRLLRPRSMAALSALVETIERHVAITRGMVPRVPAMAHSTASPHYDQREVQC